MNATPTQTDKLTRFQIHGHFHIDESLTPIHDNLGRVTAYRTAQGKIVRPQVVLEIEDPDNETYQDLASDDEMGSIGFNFMDYDLVEFLRLSIERIPMGVAAYYRGNALISRQIRENDRPREFEIMDILNSLKKYSDAGAAWEHLVFSYDNNKRVWWVHGYKPDEPLSKRFSHFGYYYKTLHEAVKRWKVQITQFHDQNGGEWIGVPSEVH